MGIVSVLGIGPGHPDYCLPIVKKRALKQDLLIGTKRHLEVIEGYQGKQFAYERISELFAYIEGHCDMNIGVLVSGDTGFYSLASTLKRKFPTLSFDFLPGISSLQYMFSVINASYEDAKLLSLHGRECNFKEALEESRYVALLTDKHHSPAQIARQLDDTVIMYVGERLSYPDERITKGQPSALRERVFESLSVVIVEKV